MKNEDDCIRALLRADAAIGPPPEFDALLARPARRRR
jgi:hypothetical protein